MPWGWQCGPRTGSDQGMRSPVGNRHNGHAEVCLISNCATFCFCQEQIQNQLDHLKRVKDLKKRRRAQGEQARAELLVRELGIHS